VTDRTPVFHGTPFDALALVGAGPAGARAPRPAAGDTVRRLRAQLAAARLAAPFAHPGAEPEPEPGPDTESAVKPLARTRRTALGPADLARLKAGAVAEVFGPAYDQDECNPVLRLAPGSDCLLGEVAELSLWAGADGLGRLRATVPALPDPAAATAAAAQAAQVFALFLGLHLCLADAVFVTAAAGDRQAPDKLPAGPYQLVLEVAAADLIPRPRLEARVAITGAEGPAARIDGLAVELRERPGVPVGPDSAGAVPRFLGRKNRYGERALLSEFHLTHAARGDMGIAFGPRYAALSARRTARPPTYGLQYLDRIMSATPGEVPGEGATHVTEYDSPADAWYYRETANASMPNLVYLETSLQSALVPAYYLGTRPEVPDEEMILRNLEGHATVLREIDLRDTTIRQRTELLSTMSVSGATLQNLAYELAVDGEPFYRGQSLFGHFSARALAEQTGLDGGRYRPNWLEGQADPPPVRTVDIAARRVTGRGPRAGSGRLALLEAIEVVDGGGDHGKGYLRAVKPVDPDDWFFGRHFHLDPVIPGSIGVESVIQGLQEWLVDSGLADGLRGPEFVVPAGVRLQWKYRGQFLPTDAEATLEVHVKDCRRTPGRVRVRADASVWKPGLRVYQLTDVAVELREPGAPRWDSPAEPGKAGREW
jgi:3-hydroxymyristoyl/3-hydroxydecanoyl-(acyl carrier protein) dehydratase